MERQNPRVLAQCAGAVLAGTFAFCCASLDRDEILLAGGAFADMPGGLSRPGQAYSRLLEQEAASCALDSDREGLLRCAGLSALRQAAQAGAHLQRCEYRRVDERAQNGSRWIAARVQVLPGEGGPWALVVLEDIHEARTQMEQLEYQARRDALTGLYNQVAGKQRIEEALRLPDRGVQAFFLFDLDGFKVINDTFGHPYGDEVLVDVAREVRTLLGKGDVAIRLGGDEYAMFLGNLRNRGAVEHMANRVLVRVARSGAQRPMAVSASLGVAIAGPETTYDELYRRADQALYAVKGSRKGSYRIWE